MLRNVETDFDKVDVVRGQRGLGMGGHHQPVQGEKDEWLTPPEILKVLGPFDLDPCAPVERPWEMAKVHYTIEDDGLSKPWPKEQRIFCNPPYGQQTGVWLERLAEHGNGIALTFARTETAMFFRAVWDRADAALFLKGRLFFYHRDGKRATHNSGAPSVLIAYGENNVQALRSSGLKGALCLWETL